MVESNISGHTPDKSLFRGYITSSFADDVILILIVVILVSLVLKGQYIMILLIVILLALIKFNSGEKANNTLSLSDAKQFERADFTPFVRTGIRARQSAGKQTWTGTIRW